MEDYNGGILQIIINHRRFDKIREFLEDQIITLSRKARYSAVRHAGAYFTKSIARYGHQQLRRICT